MAKKIKVPAIWYNEKVNMYNAGIKQEPKHLKQLQIRLKAMQSNKTAVHDLFCKTTLEELKKFVIEAKNNLGKSKNSLDKFLLKYEPCRIIKPNYQAAYNYLIRHKSKINNSTDIDGYFDCYNQMAVIEDKFYLPCKSDNNMGKIFRLFENAGIEIY